MHRILLVDDEQNVLNALRRELDSEFEIETFTSPSAALARSQEAVFDLVIADYLMPDMNGIQFLKQFGQIQPEAIRLILSGQADINALVNAINESHIYRFFAKPWDADELKLCLSQALGQRDQLRKRRQLAGNRQQAPRNAPYRILLIDSDEGNLSVMKSGLTMVKYPGLYGAVSQEASGDPKLIPDDYPLSVEACNSASAALGRLAQQDYDLVIAAQEQRDMNCLDLLRSVKKLQPEAALILIGADPDEKLLSLAINELQVRGFLNISWGTHELKSDIMRRSWNQYQLKAATLQALAARELLRDA